ncbi:hypothetical protein N7466_005839 [Penicillium verhagenii]|uniref:uncharacterized protein n=1 Tax=Penicillium verhagenii TaxID=1562060 RepID=UPI0025451034|nr:uncharacterized protein N7466_005839 [Penicillium verhagenii]KAJ5930346.1 hypothetical protein N7466_005839 [Penicillium verhagenii]
MLHGSLSAASQSRSVPHLSQIIHLEPQNKPRCVGYAQTQGRLCDNETNVQGRNYALHLLDQGTEELEAGNCIADLLEELASYVLCTRLHQSQASGLAARWQEQVRSYMQSQPDPTRETTQQSTRRRVAPNPDFARGPVTEPSLDTIQSNYDEVLGRYVQRYEQALARMASFEAEQRSQFSASLAENVDVDVNPRAQGRNSRNVIRYATGIEGLDSGTRNDTQNNPIRAPRAISSRLNHSNYDEESLSHTRRVQRPSANPLTSRQTTSVSIPPPVNEATILRVQENTSPTTNLDLGRFERLAASRRYNVRNNVPRPLQTISETSLIAPRERVLGTRNRALRIEEDNAERVPRQNTRPFPRQTSNVTRREIEGPCGICLEDLQGVEFIRTGGYDDSGSDSDNGSYDDTDNDGEVERTLVYCKAQCGNNFHETCLTEWLDHIMVPTCPMCRIEWED